MAFKNKIHMKKIFLLFSFIGLFAFTSSAQTKACCASKSASNKVCTADIDKAASADASIVKQISNNGDVNYIRKETCPITGKVTMASVEYCSKKGKFVNVSPSEAASTAKACCTNGNKASCMKKASKTASTKKAKTSPSAKLVNKTAGQ